MHIQHIVPNTRTIAGILLGLAAGFTLSALPALAAGEANQIIPCMQGDCAKADAVANLSTGDLQGSVLPLIARTLIYGMAIVSFVVFTVAGVMYALNPGEDAAIKKAKNMVVYGIVGVGFAAASYTIVHSILNLDI